MSYPYFGGIRSAVTSVALFAALIPVALCASADDSYGLIVKLRNGEERSFILSERPEVKFEDSSCLITCNNLVSTFDMSEIDVATFGPAIVAVSEIKGSDVTLDLSDSAVAVVSGIAGGDNVSVFTLDGVLCASTRADANGVARVSLDVVAPGSVYILSVNNVNKFKLYKK